VTKALAGFTRRWSAFPRERVPVVNMPLRMPNAGHQVSYEPFPDDSLPACQHRASDLPSWSCEFDSRHPLQIITPTDTWAGGRPTQCDPRLHRQRISAASRADRHGSQTELAGQVEQILASTRTLMSVAANPASMSLPGARVLAEFGDDPGR